MKYTRYELDKIIETLQDCILFSFANLDKMQVHNTNINKAIEIVKEKKGEINE